MKLNIRLLLGCYCCSFISCRATECYKNNGTIQSSIIFRGVPVPNGFNFLMKKKSNWWLVSFFQRYTYLYPHQLVHLPSLYTTCLSVWFVSSLKCLEFPWNITLFTIYVWSYLQEPPYQNKYVCIWITLYVYYKSMRNKNQYYRLRHHHHHPPSAELAFTLANKNFKKCIRFTNYLPTYYYCNKANSRKYAMWMRW